MRGTDSGQHLCRRHLTGGFWGDLAGRAFPEAAGRLKPEKVPFRVSLHGSALAFQVLEYRKRSRSFADNSIRPVRQLRRERQFSMGSGARTRAPTTLSPTIPHQRICRILSFEPALGKSKLPQIRKNRHRQAERPSRQCSPAAVFWIHISGVEQWDTGLRWRSQ